MPSTSAQHVFVLFCFKTPIPVVTTSPEARTSKKAQMIWVFVTAMLTPWRRRWQRFSAPRYPRAENQPTEEALQQQKDQTGKSCKHLQTVINYSGDYCINHYKSRLRPDMGTGTRFKDWHIKETKRFYQWVWIKIGAKSRSRSWGLTLIKDQCLKARMYLSSFQDPLSFHYYNKYTGWWIGFPKRNLTIPNIYIYILGRSG